MSLVKCSVLNVTVSRYSWTAPEGLQHNALYPTPYPPWDTTSHCTGYSWWNIGRASSGEIACTKHSLSLAHSLPFHLTPFLSPFARRLRVRYSWLSCVTTAHHWYLNFPKYNVCLSKLVCSITRLTLMTYRNQWLSTRQPYLLSMSFSHSNLTVKIQRADWGPKDTALWLMNFSTRDSWICFDTTPSHWMLHNGNIMNGGVSVAMDVGGSAYVLY